MAITVPLRKKPLAFRSSPTDMSHYSKIPNKLSNVALHSHGFFIPCSFLEWSRKIPAPLTGTSSPLEIWGLSQTSFVIDDTVQCQSRAGQFGSTHWGIWDWGKQKSRRTLKTQQKFHWVLVGKWGTWSKHKLKKHGSICRVEAQEKNR